jgi:hypothetical protein
MDRKILKYHKNQKTTNWIYYYAATESSPPNGGNNFTVDNQYALISDNEGPTLFIFAIVFRTQEKPGK